MNVLCAGNCDTLDCVCASSPVVALVHGALTHEGLSLVALSRRTNVAWQTCAWIAWALVMTNRARYDECGRVVPT